MTDWRDTGGGGKDLDYEAETLTAFKKRIDGILDQLAGSPASPKHIGNQTVTPDAYGTGFSAAEDLSALYDKVHTQLKTLSRLFGDQLEALGIATQIVDKGYQGVEDDHLRRFQSIQQQVEEYQHKRQNAPETAPDTEAAVADKSDNPNEDFS
ncbi:hypothetical protein V1L54_23540 [Streptomyces sp. TRM 70361]|uniref:hypothetical protein n=1 Tax=Streptomyces sp. TRM 70361 TaxID=3116553 RepID=UPI002E7B86E7|nr:hypothetical protein [Streptomyces sp. TRM 70361]MEE1942338.1 hypothetical protein [Streptomyces sp. TRM 70361]